MELRGYCRGNKPILGLFSRHYYIGISSKSQGGRTAFSRRLPHSAAGRRNAPGRMSRGVEADDYVYSLSQKCTHFFEEMQSAASHIVGAKSAPLIPACRPGIAPLPCPSSPKQTRFAGLCLGPHLARLQAEQCFFRRTCRRKKQPLHLIPSSADDGTLRGSCVKSGVVTSF